MFHRWFALCLAVSPICGDEVALVRVGETWRYFPGVSEPSGRTIAWTEPAFDDTKWLEGIAGFSSVFGYEGTALPDMAGEYASAYFRKTFTLEQPAEVKWLTLRVDYSDGFVAYLNGKEVARRNLAGPSDNPIPFNAAATNSHPRGAIEEIDVGASAILLKLGTNVLAIQAHNASLQDFDFVLVAELLANFTRGPFLQNASSNRVQIIWKTFAPADARVEYGTNSALGLSVSDTNLLTTHVATLIDLAPDTTYYYRIRSSANGQSAVSPVEWFRTLKTSGSFSFVTLGDTGTGSRAQYEIAGVLRRAKPDLVLHAGDVIYPSFTYAYTDTRCMSVYGAHMRNIPFFFALGNHDLYSGNGPFLDAFYSPTNNVPPADHAAAGTSPEHYYSFDHGDGHFVVLFAPFLNQYQLKAGDPQHRWLEADLAASKKPWKFLMFHHPINTSSLHRFDDYNSNGVWDRTDVMDAVLPLASKYGVQLILAAHDHAFERFNPTNGVHSVVTGGGGAGLYPLSQLDSGSAQFWVRHNCVKVTVDGDRLALEALSQSGEVFDSMTIYRALSSPQVYQSAWHSPVVESASADDGDGNVIGQEFDFIGRPIPTMPGGFSNLGQVYVNNDRTNLYVAIEQCMIYPNNHIFLFVESPRQRGVTNLVSVGNGRIDPRGEGADGLDFLANLAFTNFAPSLGCILGDEFGDSQSRSFTRNGFSFDAGQGVFLLEAKLGDVFDARLQQFNGSPQFAGVAGEANANFVELAVPYSALGRLQPGDLIKIGAVVGGAGLDPSASRQARQLDSSFLGTAFSSSGMDGALLEGVSVQLAVDPDPDSDGLLTADEKKLGTDPGNRDSDGDGLPDGWEVLHNLDATSVTGDDGSNGDPDRDGASNGDEFSAGTNPRDPRSALRVKLEVAGPFRYRLSWPGVHGKKYQIQIADGRPAGFVDIANTNFPRRADSALQVFEEELRSLPAAARFYRVLIVP
ncbi:MAG: metallophosphoesterase [Verrucomicrobia bacterium]|nr:metallophosphoesterase [Verrucomicrobiota bacterium]